MVAIHRSSAWLSPVCAAKTCHEIKTATQEAELDPSSQKAEYEGHVERNTATLVVHSRREEPKEATGCGCTSRFRM